MMRRKHLLVSMLTSLYLVAAAIGYTIGCNDSVISGGSDDFGPDPTGDMASGCGLVTCASLNANCGLIGDGCGGTVDCGSCAAPQTCGGGGTQFQCGGNQACVPLTQTAACSALSANCGEVSDGCGGTIVCGTCSGTDTCGGGGTAFQCGSGGGGTCTKLTCAAVNATCGTIGDGCGGTVDCGACTVAGQTCGGGGIAGQCGSAMCTPRTCAQAGATCGFVGDGCGGIINYNGGTGPGCGSCSVAGQTCGGGGMPNVCGTPTPVCSNLCLKQKVCDPTTVTTTLKGTVTVPGHDDTVKWGTPDPVPGALVYIPNSQNGAIDPFTPGVTCDQCGANVSGSPLVTTTTAVDGTFTLTNVPCGVDVPVVIQMGRWRRKVVVPAVQCCVTTTMTNAQTHLPRNKGEGDIPAIAVVTGNADPMECVLPKIGIDTAEFTDPNGTGRVNFYQASTGGAGATISGATPKDTALWGNLTTMKKYDLIIIDCKCT